MKIEANDGQEKNVDGEEVYYSCGFLCCYSIELPGVSVFSLTELSGSSAGLRLSLCPKIKLAVKRAGCQTAATF